MVKYLSVWCIWLYILIITRILEWICTMYCSEFQGTPCSKQLQCPKFKWLQRMRTHNHWAPKGTVNHSSILAFETIELCCDNLSLWRIWLCVLTGFPKYGRLVGRQFGKMAKNWMKITKSTFWGQISGGTWGKNNFGGNAEVPRSPFKGNPVLCHIRVLEWTYTQ